MAGRFSLYLKDEHAAMFKDLQEQLPRGAFSKVIAETIELAHRNIDVIKKRYNSNILDGLK